MFMNTSWSQETTTIYLIRHAEKAGPSADTELSASGNDRAIRWSNYFADKKIEAVYATPYKRTINTGKPLADKNNLEVITYKPSEMNLSAIAKQYEGKNVVIVGHSNTIPIYVNKFIGENKYPDMEESDFGSLYIIEKKGNSITHRLEKL